MISIRPSISLRSLDRYVTLDRVQVFLDDRDRSSR